MSGRRRRNKDQFVLPGLVDGEGTVTLHGRQELPAESQAYLDSLQPSNCPRCGRAQKTPGGKPMVCPRCQNPKDYIARPTIPLPAAREGQAGRRRK